ncbi:hypothetical protein [Tolypothrix bouteillei]|uniref:Uncharacterized protein n=1 Tax=Tolypothrix bouteillei VB521301 TaxID=1479485 RepID=A0A8S9T4H0_9CYAN|nr:hypothetical protein DA73_0400019030 [Tolypothrix bouteillei VB521301]
MVFWEFQALQIPQPSVKDVNLSYAQFQLARRATQSSERQFDVEEQKQKLKRGTEEI